MLKPVDKVSCFVPQGTAGGKQDYRESTILHIDPESTHQRLILKFDMFFVTLNPEHQVRRIAHFIKGKLKKHMVVTNQSADTFWEREENKSKRSNGYKVKSEKGLAAAESE